jgi:hypothetical protein
MIDRTAYHAALRQFAAAAESFAKAGEALNAAQPPAGEPDDEVSLGSFALALQSLRRLSKPGYRHLFMYAAVDMEITIGPPPAGPPAKARA